MIPRPVQDLGYAKALRPLLFRSHGGDPERVHEAMIAGLARIAGKPTWLAAAAKLLGSASAPIQFAGMQFRGPVGLAAGMDKNAVAAKAWAAMGFGFVELGTVTALEQPGNDQPRLFRLPNSAALINRMGFNNFGAPAVAASLARQDVWRGNNAAGIPIGISLGKSKVIAVGEAVEDYVASMRALAPHADYLAVNVSSPNTPGLRELQDRSLLDDLLTALTAVATEQADENGSAPLPILVKVAPDLTNSALDDVIEVCALAGAAGLIATNTTLSRAGIGAGEESIADEAGGLSGGPLRARALEVVRYLSANQDLPVIGVGGIATSDDALAMLDAGAKAVQLYTGFIYHGTALVSGINRAHAERAALQATGNAEQEEPDD